MEKKYIYYTTISNGYWLATGKASIVKTLKTKCVAVDEQTGEELTFLLANENKTWFTDKALAKKELFLAIENAQKLRAKQKEAAHREDTYDRDEDMDFNMSDYEN